MKLLLCNKCNDVRKLDYQKTTCKCGMSWGWYESDGLHAVYGGDALPIGIANDSIIMALNTEFFRRSIVDPTELGIRFEAFTIPENAPTIRRETPDEYTFTSRTDNK